MTTTEPVVEADETFTGVPYREPEDLGLPPESVADPESVFHLAFLDERLSRIRMERQTRTLLCDVRLQQVQEERKNIVKQLGREELETTDELARVRGNISKKHGIDLPLYAYDDATGTLRLLSVV